MPFDLNTFDFNDPNYAAVFQERMERLLWLEQNPDAVPGLKTRYKDHVDDFINDWGMTFDPRNLEIGLPAYVPFILFPKQRDAVKWIVDAWRNKERRVLAKSRDVGISWLTVGVACTMCNLYEGFVFNFGSRKEEYVDQSNKPKSLFFKARKFQNALPRQFKGDWDIKKHAPNMQIIFPHTGSFINGEAGDGIGRGDRASIYVVDESAFLERPEMVENSLSATTNCRIDVSSANGTDNPFYRKWRDYPESRKFLFGWRDDPRKDDVWYAKQVNELPPVTVAQEIDINFSASVTGIIIPSLWTNAAVDACRKLGIEPTGARIGGLDVADEGKDNNAMAAGYGCALVGLEEWSGTGSDIYDTTVKAFDYADEWGLEEFKFDQDGLGAGVRGDARVINEKRQEESRRAVTVTPYRGSDAVYKPEKEDVPGRKNKDYFANRKAQMWFRLRRYFLETYRAVVEEKPYNPDYIISLPAGHPLLQRLLQELSQVTYKLGPTGKIIVNKAPDDSRSPNLADAVVIWRAEAKTAMRISDDAVA